MLELQQLIRREILALTNSDNGTAKGLEEVKKQVQQLSLDVSRIRLELTSQQGIITDVVARVTALESGVSDISNRVAAGERALSTLTADMGSVVSGLSSLGQRVDAAEQGIVRLDTLTSDLVGRSSTLESGVSALTSDLASLNTRVTTELPDVRLSVSQVSDRVTILEASAVLAVGQGLEKDGNNIRVIAGDGICFNNQNQLQLNLSEQMKGVGFDHAGVIVKIDTTYFSYDSSGQITLKDNISGLQGRIATLESLKIDDVAPPLSISESGGSRILGLLYDGKDFKLVNQFLTLSNHVAAPRLRFPLELDPLSNTVSLSSNYRMRTGQWSGQLEYQTPSLSWRVNVTVNLMRVNDWLILSFPRFSTNSILASGKFVMSFVEGLSPGWATGATAPSTTTNPLSTTFAAIQFVNGNSRVDAFRILAVSEWTNGELEISNYGGTYAAHTKVDWAPMTLMYPCLG
uniref:Sigma 1 protein n=1 Tax=Mammalian orthoreovirus TaxID=351073 RepID=A0A7D0TAT1_9REOV|nr:Sigma 1 protein [Mammalian orthoreovirus]